MEVNLMVGGIECYEKNGTAYLKLETVARGLGFTQVAASGNEVIRWERVRKYLSDLGVPTCGDDDFIPENVFYRLAMKAKNEAAETFQAKVADEIIPSIRRTGGYGVNREVLKAVKDIDDKMVRLHNRVCDLEEALTPAERKRLEKPTTPKRWRKNHFATFLTDEDRALLDALATDMQLPMTQVMLIGLRLLAEERKITV